MKYVVQELQNSRSLVKAKAYRPVVEGKSCIIADQSGSGKTLAYLAPVVERLKREETEGLSKSASRSPRTVILVPTAELASQNNPSPILSRILADGSCSRFYEIVDPSQSTVFPSALWLQQEVFDNELSWKVSNKIWMC
ncbi:DEAD-box ATP-dependent RNA helicase 50 [Bienertia sinuspersici]